MSIINEGIPIQQKTSRTAKVFALSLGSTLSMITGLAFTMIATRCLSKHDYATFRQTFLAYEFAAPLLMLGLPSAIYYFFPREKEMKRGVIVDNVALLTGAGLLFSLFIAFGGNQLLAIRFNNPALGHTLHWLIPHPLIIMPIAGFAAIMVCVDRTKTLATYNVLSSIILAATGIAAILLTKSYVAPIMVRIVVPILFCLLRWIDVQGCHGPIRWPKWIRMKEMVKYSIPLGLASMLGGITLTAQYHCRIPIHEDFAIYINGAMEIPVIGIITGSITTVVFAEMAALCAKAKSRRIAVVS